MTSYRRVKGDVLAAAETKVSKRLIRMAVFCLLVDMTIVARCIPGGWNLKRFFEVVLLVWGFVGCKMGEEG